MTEKQTQRPDDETLTKNIIKALRKVFDPEIPCNVFDLGLIYNIQLDDDDTVIVTMTLTAPNCPVADSIVRDVETKVNAVEGVTKAKINLVFDPPWTKDQMGEAAKLELGLI